MIPNEITIDGVKYRRVDRIANRVSILGMYGCHLFEKFSGPTVDAVYENWKSFCLDTKGSKYGMPLLCPVIVMEDQKELRRVGEMIDFYRPQHHHQWLDPVRADPDIGRILAAAAVANEVKS